MPARLVAEPARQEGWEPGEDQGHRLGAHRQQGPVYAGQQQWLAVRAKSGALRVNQRVC